MEDSAVYRTGLVGLALLFVAVGLSVGMTGVAAAQSTGFVDVNASNLDGSGTDADPYVITNASELQAMEDDLDANYTLSNDIDASGTAQWNGGKGFDPVGEETNINPDEDSFQGKFDGSGHTIHALTINRPETSGIGLFARTASATVEDVHLRKISITGDEGIGAIAGHSAAGSVVRNVSATGSVTGSDTVGGLLGFNGIFEPATVRNSSAGVAVDSSRKAGGLIADNNGLIQNVSASGSVNGGEFVGGLVGINTGGTIEVAYANGSVTGSGPVGGLIGGTEEEATVRTVFATGAVTGSGSEIGGLIGEHEANSSVRNAYATGTVNGEQKVGGLVGSLEAEVQDVYATGRVTATSSYSDPGGLFAYVENVPVQDAYWDTQSTGTSNAYTFVSDEGPPTSDGIGLSTAEMQGSQASANMPGLEFGTTWQSQQNDYPTLLTQIRTPPSPSSVDISISSRPTSVAPGDSATVQFSVTNTGANAPTGGIQFDTPAGITAENVFFTGGIDSGETITRVVSIDTNENMQTDTYTIRADASVGTRTDTASFDLTVGEDDGLSRFDQTGSGTINFSDVIAAIEANNEGTEIGGQPVSFTNVINVIQAHNQGTTV